MDPPLGKQHEEEPRAKELAYTISKMQGSVITRLDRHEKATQAGRNYLSRRERHRPLLQLTKHYTHGKQAEKHRKHHQETNNH